MFLTFIMSDTQFPSSTPSADVIGECQLAIFGFGKTIAESLQDPSKVPADLYNNLQKLVRRHRDRRFFSSGGSFSPDELVTLYSLQDGVSRMPDPTRGTGTVQIIEAFQDLGVAEGKKPEMVLISGRSRILFDSRYSMATGRETGGKKVIAFNDENSLEGGYCGPAISATSVASKLIGPRPHSGHLFSNSGNRCPTATQRGIPNF
jgi:hypothetical protein